MAQEVRLSDATESKAGLRREMSARRLALDPEFVAKVGPEIATRCMSRAGFSSATDVGLYWPVRGEVPTQELFRGLQAGAQRVYLPRVQTAEGKIEFVRVREESDLMPGVFGVFAPGPALEAVNLAGLQALVIPGLAFDLRGARIGWGQGYYDRALRGFSGLRVALAYEFQVLARIPEGDRDERVDLIVTESRVIECDRHS